MRHCGAVPIILVLRSDGTHNALEKILEALGNVNGKHSSYFGADIFEHTITLSRRVRSYAFGWSRSSAANQFFSTFSSATWASGKSSDHRLDGQFHHREKLLLLYRHHHFDNQHEPHKSKQMKSCRAIANKKQIPNRPQNLRDNTLSATLKIPRHMSFAMKMTSVA